MNNQKGTSAIELIIVLIAVTALIGIASVSFIKWFDWYSERQTEHYFINLARAFEIHYKKNVEFSFEKLKYYYNTTGPDCASTGFSFYLYQPVCGRTYTPWYYFSYDTDSYTTSNGYSFYDNEIVVYDLTDAEKILYGYKEDYSVIKNFLDANCKVIAKFNSTSISGLMDDTEQYILSCKDGWDQSIRIYMTNYPDSDSNGRNGDGRPSINTAECYAAFDSDLAPDFDPKKVLRYEFRSAGKDKTFYTGDDIVYKWNTSELDRYYMEESRKKIKKVLKVIEEFHYDILKMERERPASVSLETYDDVSVPWEWRLMAESGASDIATALHNPCNITNISTCRPSRNCSCSGSSYWSYGGGTPTIKSMTADVMCKLLKSNMLSWEDVYDAFGWHIRVDLVSATTNGYPIVPRDDYLTYATFTPPYVTKVSTAWGLEESIATGN